MATDDLIRKVNVPGGSAPGAPTASVVSPFRISRIIECANLTCFNRSNEGAFAAVTIHHPSARHRPVTLLLCMPCVEAVTAVMQ